MHALPSTLSFPSCLTHPVAAAMMHPPSASLAGQQLAESWLMPKLWPISWAMVAATPMEFSEWSCTGRDSGQEDCCSQPPTLPLLLAKPHSLIKARAFNYMLHLPIIWDGWRTDKERMAGSVISTSHVRNEHSKSFNK